MKKTMFKKASLQNTIINIMALTGIALTILAAYAAFMGGKVLFISSVFQSLGVCAVIYFGFFLTRMFESQYVVLEAAFDITFMVVVLLTAGWVFGWFSSTPVWVLVLMAMVIYGVLMLLNLVRTRKQIVLINQMLARRHHAAPNTDWTDEPEKVPAEDHNNSGSV